MFLDQHEAKQEENMVAFATPIKNIDPTPPGRKMFLTCLYGGGRAALAAVPAAVLAAVPAAVLAAVLVAIHAAAPAAVLAAVLCS